MHLRLNKPNRSNCQSAADGTGITNRCGTVYRRSSPRQAHLLRFPPHAAAQVATAAWNTNWRACARQWC